MIIPLINPVAEVSERPSISYPVVARICIQERLGSNHGTIDIPRSGDDCHVYGGTRDEYNGF
jgi:hypothetical protein